MFQLPNINQRRPGDVDAYRDEGILGDGQLLRQPSAVRLHLLKPHYRANQSKCIGPNCLALPRIERRRLGGPDTVRTAIFLIEGKLSRDTLTCDPLYFTDQYTDRISSGTVASFVT